MQQRCLRVQVTGKVVLSRRDVIDVRRRQRIQRGVAVGGQRRNFQRDGVVRADQSVEGHGVERRVEANDAERPAALAVRTLHALAAAAAPVVVAGAGSSRMPR